MLPVPLGLENLFLANTVSRKVFIVLKSLKVLRALELDKLVVQQFSRSYGSKVLRYLRLFRMIFWLLVGSHIIGCIFYILACDSEGIPRRDTWLFAGGFASERSVVDRYIPSVYYVFTSLTTVGYGDITVKNTSEMIFASVVMLIGSVQYAIILGSVVKIVEIIGRDADSEKNLVSVTRWMDNKGIDVMSANRVIDVLKFQRSIDCGTYDALSNVSPVVRRHLNIEAHVPTLLQNDTFVNLSDALLRELAQGMELHTAMKSSIVIQAGEIGEYVFIVHRGRCAIMNLSEDEVIGEYKSSESFGLAPVLIPEILSSNTIEALENTIMYTLKGAFIWEVLKLFPNELEHLKKAVVQSELVPVLKMTSRKTSSMTNVISREQDATVTICIKSASLDPTMQLRYNTSCELKWEGGGHFVTNTRWASAEPVWETVCQIGPISESRIRSMNITFNILDTDEENEESIRVIRSGHLKCADLFKEVSKGLDKGTLTLAMDDIAAGDPPSKIAGVAKKDTLRLRYKIESESQKLQWNMRHHEEIWSIIEPWTACEEEKIKRASSKSRKQSLVDVIRKASLKIPPKQAGK
eukprot:g46.t1